MVANAAELVDDGKSMPTFRLAVLARVDTHRRVILESSVFCVHALCPNTFTAFISRKLHAAVLAGSPWPLDGAVSVQTFLSDQAAPPIEVIEVVLAGNCPDVFVYVTAWLAAPIQTVGNLHLIAPASLESRSYLHLVL